MAVPSLSTHATLELSESHRSSDHNDHKNKDPCHSAHWCIKEPLMLKPGLPRIHEWIKICDASPKAGAVSTGVKWKAKQHTHK